MPVHRTPAIGVASLAKLVADLEAQGHEIVGHGTGTGDHGLTEYYVITRPAAPRKAVAR
jgi:hypothetical protein